MAVSEQILQRSADAYRRIRNTARFLLSNLTGFNPATDLLPAEDMLALDRWAVDRTLLLQRELQEHYGEYRFWNVYSKIHNFCVQELGGFYLDIIKDRQYTTGADSKARRSARPRCSTSPKRWCAGSRRSWRSPPTSCGSTCRASATNR
jgi:isoleucyl-tRNA synthetase